MGEEKTTDEKSKTVKHAQFNYQSTGVFNKAFAREPVL